MSTLARSAAAVAAAIAAAAGIGAAWSQSAGPDIADGYALAVDEAGAIRVPAVDFRADWTLLGSWIVAGGEEVDGQAGALGVHVTYTQPGVAEHVRETGEFPDGAVLVKELLSAETQTMTTGVISHATELEGWFVMVKDAEGRFPGNGLWGDGWGWAYFTPDAPETTITEDYKVECLECHVPAQDTDWVYVWGYPVLKGPSVPVQ